jgi:hypothetical protein
VALPFYIKEFLMAKEEELWKLKYFTMQKNINLPTPFSFAKFKSKKPYSNILHW